MTHTPLRILILGGTGEAMQLARSLEGDPRFAPTYSVAGRTQHPRLPNLPCRSGGFGGPDGLADYLGKEAVEVLVDATHPFAARMSTHGVMAAKQAGVALLALRRPAWTPGPEDHWHRVPDMAAAVQALGTRPQRVFLTIGQGELAAFCQAPWHRYIIRSVDLPPVRPPDCLCITERGPFRLEDEQRLLRQHRIDALVTKNSGGEATRPKLEAARICGTAVIMVDRPWVPPAPAEVPDPKAALDWLGAHYADSRPTLRGV
ncbi:precorrin-6A/cobalt-precorrin-6A reductase [Ectothiorhodospira magna]|uniref:Precorrin-6A/cobalt-precorrin-6A reductase n=1 Tax=Ectothiorhodospira magna TaxID=867345 RepID=A0A1H9DRE5_9GAMM|nr:cobalt-precorrin-6A reductase [Ectothiorhodospira magna]SEQ15857.1 precorrin-6A/cobalt-precorrin-6A reductase [Ectothiorhodospira magna]